MVCYDSTIHNSIRDVIQFVYRKVSMDTMFIKEQTICTFIPNNQEFDKSYPVDITDPKGGFPPGVLQVGVNACQQTHQSAQHLRYEFLWL